ncbi:hypothetical protein NL676_009478 [Syzygium grande]|nr:hypothetical protein NL676_009478 [Syzygium grande]
MDALWLKTRIHTIAPSISVTCLAHQHKGTPKQFRSGQQLLGGHRREETGGGGGGGGSRATTEREELEALHVQWRWACR